MLGEPVVVIGGDPVMRMAPLAPSWCASIRSRPAWSTPLAPPLAGEDAQRTLGPKQSGA